MRCDRDEARASDVSAVLQGGRVRRAAERRVSRSPPCDHPATWLRSQVVKLGDGLAITFSDISEAKATQERYAHLAEFTDSVFQNAPFSIVATDTERLITAMNVAAEKLTGYSREELVGKAPLTVLHDERELLGQGGQHRSRGDDGEVSDLKL